MPSQKVSTIERFGCTHTCTIRTYIYMSCFLYMLAACVCTVCSAMLIQLLLCSLCPRKTCMATHNPLLVLLYMYIYMYMYTVVLHVQMRCVSRHSSWRELRLSSDLPKRTTVIYRLSLKLIDKTTLTPFASKRDKSNFKNS